MIQPLIALLMLCGQICKSTSSYCKPELPRNFHESQWINAETQKFVTDGHWDCLWNLTNFLFLRAPQCPLSAKVLWSDRHFDEEDSQPPEPFLTEGKREFDRNRHNFFVYQSHRFSTAFTSPKCHQRPVSIYGDYTIVQRYVELGEPLEIVCLKCDWGKLFTGKGQKFYTAGEIRDVFMNQTELKRNFLDLHQFQTTYSRRGNWKRLKSIGEQLDHGRLLLTGVLLHGTFFCVSDSLERPEVIYNIDTILSTSELKRAKLQAGPVPLISDSFQRNWESHWSLGRYESEKDAPVPIVKEELNLQISVIWSSWSCCKSCVKLNHRVREGRRSVLKIEPDSRITMKLKSKKTEKHLDTVDRWLALAPYRTEGIPLGSTLLRNFNRFRHQLLEEFDLVDWDQSYLGVYYSRDLCSVANLIECQQQQADCHRSKLEANPSRMPPATKKPPELKPTVSPTPDFGLDPIQIEIGQGSRLLVELEQRKSYLFRCNIGDRSLEPQILWLRRAHKRAVHSVPHWNKSIPKAIPQLWFQHQGQMHINSARQVWGGQYECGLGRRWFRFQITFARKDLTSDLTVAIGIMAGAFGAAAVVYIVYVRVNKYLYQDVTIENNENP